MGFEYPDDVRFTCQQCGDCCRTWNVLVTEAEREALRSLEWPEGSALAGVRPTAAVKVPGMEGRHRLARQDDGACVFLADNQCALHREFGADAKPLMCRLYPFAFYAVGERTTVDCSFFCQGISRNVGEPLSVRESEWVEQIASGAASRSDSFELRKGTPIGPDLLWELEHFLLRFLEDDGLSIVDRVRCCVEFTRLGTTGDPTLPTAATLREAIATGLPVRVQKSAPQSLDEDQHGFFHQWVYLVVNPPPASLYELAPEPMRLALEKRKREAARYKNAMNTPIVDGRALDKTFADVSAVEINLTGELVTLFRRYFQAKIIGQRFLMAGEQELPFVEAVPRLFLGLPVAAWTAKALAAQAGAQEVQVSHLQHALRLVDRTLGQMSAPQLTKKQARAWDYLLYESSLVEAASAVIIG